MGAIHIIVGIQSSTLMVFYTQAHCWQFRVLTSVGGVIGEKKIYYTPQAAEKAGREWVGNGS
ncbi:MAG: hypothetical protein NVS2B14_06960 [Chamaesiphon sp.]